MDVSPRGGAVAIIAREVSVPTASCDFIPLAVWAVDDVCLDRGVHFGPREMLGDLIELIIWIAPWWSSWRWYQSTSSDWRAVGTYVRNLESGLLVPYSNIFCQLPMCTVASSFTDGRGGC